MFKRIFVILVLLLLCFGNFIVSAENDVFYIGRESDLNIMKKYPDATFYLKDNIVFSKPSDVMFSDSENQFMGTLDGKGYTLSFLSIETDGEVAAFIGYNGGKITDLHFINSNISGESDSTVVGGIVAYNNGVIENCSFQGMLISNGNAFLGTEIAAVNNGQILSNPKENGSISVQSGTSSSQTFSVTTDSTSVTEQSSSSDFEILYNATSIISSESRAETSSIKENSSKTTDKKNSSAERSSSKVTYSDRPTTEDALSVFYSDEEDVKNIPAVVLLGLCIVLILFACGYVVFKEIESKRKNKKVQ